MQHMGFGAFTTAAESVFFQLTPEVMLNLHPGDALIRSASFSNCNAPTFSPMYLCHLCAVADALVGFALHFCRCRKANLLSH
jgi:hypothetical protein